MDVVACDVGKEMEGWCVFLVLGFCIGRNSDFIAIEEKYVDEESMFQDNLPQFSPLTKIGR